MTTRSGFADQSITKTYQRLRLLVCIALITLPLVTGISALLVGNHEWQPSLSDYYFVVRDGGLPRAIFLIFLAFLGCVLFAYRGLDKWDDWIHNAAGIFSFGVALFPMRCDVAEHQYCVPGLLPGLHLPLAGALYVFAIWSVLYGGGSRLKDALRKLPDSEKWLARRCKIKYVPAGLMFIGVGGFFVHALCPEWKSGFSWIFWIEYIGFLGFGLYWLCLMLFVGEANKLGRSMNSKTTSDSHVDRSELHSIAPGTDGRGPKVELWVDIP
jgi:hypothetical protein